jgi:hypothetical protein
VEQKRSSKPFYLSMSSVFSRFGRSQALARLDRSNVLAKASLGLLVVGGILQVIQGWASAPGDVLWILAALMGSVYAIIRATLIWSSSGRVPWVVVPFIVLLPYTALVFVFWLLVDTDVIRGANTQMRVGLFAPVVLLFCSYLWIKIRVH